MDALILRSVLTALSLFCFTGATYKTDNFVVSAPTDEIARKVALAAEEYRRDLAIFWLDHTLPNWSRPCRLRVRPGSLGAGGETKFQFVGGEVINWNMYVQGSLERILDSVLPHEVNHTIFACHFRRPLPRWADEGAATLFEHRSEQVKQLGLLNQVIKSDKEFIDLGRLLSMKEYPRGYRPMLTMYAEGYALADFLVQQGGRRKYLKFLADGEKIGWPQAIKLNYHHGGVESLQKNWKGWILAGMPKLSLPKGHMLASADRRSSVLGAARPTILDEYTSDAVVRSQSPDEQDPEQTARLTRPTHRTAAVATTNSNRTSLESFRESGRDSSPAGKSVSAGHSLQPAVSGNAARTASDGKKYRAASFEAPAPASAVRRSSGSSSTRRSATPASRSPLRSAAGRRPSSERQPGLESTGLSRPTGSSSSPFSRKHLPQERSAVTGSTPQWAGFPRQKELF